MPLNIGNHRVDRVLVVDDDENAREGYGYPIEDLGLRAVFQDKPLPNLKTFVSGLSRRADAVFSDYRLGIRTNYAHFDGDALVAACYKNQIPAVLCTTFTDVDYYLNRAFLRYIPVLLRTNDPQPDVIQDGLARCVAEFSGNFLPSRKPWKVLVRIHDVDLQRQECHVIVPGWNINEKITLHLDNLPRRIRQDISQGKRFHAQVNLGADSFHDLYFDGWENS